MFLAAIACVKGVGEIFKSSIKIKPFFKIFLLLL